MEEKGLNYEAFKEKGLTECEATSMIQIDIMKNKIPLPEMSWSVKDINMFIHHPIIHLSLIHI